MTIIDSEKGYSNKSVEELFEVLSMPANYQKLMPESVSKFESDEGSFLFGLMGMPEVRLVMGDKTPHTTIQLKAASSKLDFSLTANINAEGEGSSVQYHFEANFNPMLKMMATKPLTNFLGELAANTGKL